MGILNRLDRDLVIQEATYGFIMALSFTTATQLGFLNMSHNELIIAILAMDIVWGAIDLVVFIDMDVLGERRRRAVLKKLYESDDPQSMRGEIYDMVGGTVFDDLDEESKEKSVDLVMGARLQDRQTRKKDYGVTLFNAVTAFVVTSLSAVPAAVCLILIADTHDACFAAAVASSVALFFTGYFMSSREDPKGRMASGLALMLLTLALTLFAAYFGG